MAGKTGKLRIIGGQWRSRNITFANVEGLRPTTNRVRETIFNWLQSSLLNANCLDLFSGSGALGFEAASRGAKSVVMVEKEAAVIRHLKDNVEMLSAESVKVLKESAETFLQSGADRFSEPFDVIFLDPPFNKMLLEKCVNELECGGWLAEDAQIYIECEKHLALDFIPTNWHLHRQKKAGQVCFSLEVRNNID